MDEGRHTDVHVKAPLHLTQFQSAQIVAWGRWKCGGSHKLAYGRQTPRLRHTYQYLSVTDRPSDDAVNTENICLG